MVETAAYRQGADPASTPRAPLGRRARLPRAGALVRRYRLAPYLLLLPSMAAIGLVLIWPVIQVALYSFQNYGLPQSDGTAPVQWIGLGNFTTTLVGLLLHRLGRVMAVFVSTSALLAWATPPVSSSVLFYWMFNPDGGVVDWALSKMPHWLVGSTDWAGFNWTTSSALSAYTVATVVVVWTAFPFIAVTVLAGLKTIPAELHEAARVDGAGAWAGFRKITFPLLKPIFLVLLLLSVIWDFNVFTQTYLLTGGLGNRDEYNLSLYLYDKAFTFPPSYGLGGALALILTIILLVITVGYVRASVRQGALT
jgi:N,N'-diacetylchitobiose transport system permease protein